MNLIGITIAFLVILYLAFQQKENLNAMVLFIVSGTLTILLAAEWIDSYAGIGVIMWGFGLFQIALAIIIALQAGGPARGWSQFKALFGRMRGR